MPIDIQTLAEPEDEIQLVEIRSFHRFQTYFEETTTAHVVTFCTTPHFLIETYDLLPIDGRTEIVIGDATDYRAQLGDDIELASRLERLRRENRLKILICANRDVHDKLYRLENATEIIWLCGSANLSQNAWRNQHNTMVVIETQAESPIDNALVDYYERIKSTYASPFMDDLAEAIESGTESRREAIELWLETGSTSQDPAEAFFAEITDTIDAQVDVTSIGSIQPGAAPADGNDGLEHTPVDPAAPVDSDDETPSESAIQAPPQQRIALSLPPIDKRDRDELTKPFTAAGGSVTKKTLTLTPGVYEQVSDRVFRLPAMRLSEDGTQLRFHADGQIYDLAEPLPDDPAWVDAALAHIEQYFALVDHFGRSNDREGVKANMFEALLWIFWAPFTSRQAAIYRAHGLSELDKSLPMLYIHGDTSSGKGKFAEFALSLISRGRVDKPVNAEEVDVYHLRRLRGSDTCFPLLIDEISADRVNSLKTIRNYWSSYWQPGQHFPRFGFISNDKRPGAPERERMRLIPFDVHFNKEDQEGEAAVNRLIAVDNPLFSWFTYEYLHMDLSLHPSGTPAPAFTEARTVFKRLYEYADRPTPSYFPDVPADTEHDVGRDRWQELLASDRVQVSQVDEGYQVRFDESMEYDFTKYIRDLPIDCRPDRRGWDVIIREPESFETWLGERVSLERSFRERLKFW